MAKQFKNTIKILFVCHGNICRSPMAEYVLRDLIEERGLSAEYHVESAATSSEELGNPMHRGTKDKLLRRGIPEKRLREKKAWQLRRSNYSEYDYLIGMDEWNLKNMKRLFGSDPQHKLYKLLDFTGVSRDIADPWYTGDFDRTYEDICEGCNALLRELEKKRC